MRIRSTLPILAIVVMALATGLAQDRSKETSLDKYFEKWLNQDVDYIITDEERAVFEKLSTSEEKDHFIEQFWFRRNGGSNAAINELKEEHYRRIAYANQTYGSGIPGWKTDRGRIYIMFGEATEIEHHTGGGSYVRKRHEGGGQTSTYPFEVWRYRNIAGVGEDVEIEFVDRSWTGEYRMVMNNWEKDLLLHIDGEGKTTLERMGLANKALRPGLHPGNINNAQYQARSGMRFKDTPFESMLRYFNLQRPPQIKQKDLQTIVETKISFTNLPFSIALHQIWIDSASALVPLTVEIPNETLTYAKLPNLRKARVGLYGRVTSMTGAVINEFEDRIASEYSDAHYQVGRTQKSLYQKTLLLPSGRYKLDLVVKDMNTGDLGTLARNIVVSTYVKDKITTSPILLARRLEPLSAFPDTPQTFVIGDVRAVPNVTARFKPTDELGVYLQVYNAPLDTVSSQPSVTIEYTIADGDKILTQIVDKAGNSIEFASSHRIVSPTTLSPLCWM